MNEREIQWLREGISADSAAARPRADCPAPDTLWAAAAGELERGELGPVVDHVAGCPACVEAWRLARETASAGADEIASAGAEGIAPTGTVEGPAPARAWPRRLAPIASIAAGLLLVVGLQFFDGGPADGPSVDRGDPPGTEAERIELLSPRELPREAFLLRWSGPEGASYRLRLREADGDLLLEEEISGSSELRVAPGVLAPYAAGSELLCTIETEPALAARPLRSTFTIELAEDPE